MLTAAAVLLGSTLAVCQEKVPADPARGPEFDKKLQEFTRLVKDRRGRKDKQAVAVLDGLLRGFDKLPARPQRRLARTVGEVLGGPRWSRSPANRELLERCAVALGRMGKLGSRDLEAAYGARKFQGARWTGVRALILKQIGKSRDRDRLDLLLKVARLEEDGGLKAAAGEALGEFGAAPQAVRKRLFEGLMRELVTVYNLARSKEHGELQRAAYERRFEAIRAPWNATLQKLSGRHHTDPHVWRDFWNKHKGDDWDRPRRRQGRRGR